MDIIKLKDVDYFIKDGENIRYILKKINTTFEKGKLYTIVGSSGSGKTTLLSLIGSLMPTSSGSIYYNNRDLKKISDEQYRKNNVSFIFQNYNLISYMTAIENVLIPMYITDNDIPADKKKTAYNLLDYIGINKQKADRLIGELSGGEQQRIAVARALANNSDVILADEPTGNLDEEMEIEIVKLLKQLAVKYNKCIILVTHSTVIPNYSDINLKLNKGKIYID